MSLFLETKIQIALQFDCNLTEIFAKREIPNFDVDERNGNEIETLPRSITYVGTVTIPNYDYDDLRLAKGFIAIYRGHLRNSLWYFPPYGR